MTEMNAIRASLVLAQDADDAALDLDGGGWNHDGLHGGIRGLQADGVAFLVEALQGSVGAIHQRDDDIAIASNLGFFHQDVVAIENGFILHGVAADFEDKHVTGAGEISQGDGFRVFQRLDRAAGGDAAYERQHGAGVPAQRLLQAAARREQFDGAAAVVVALQQALFFQVADVLVHGGQRVQLQPLANFLERWRVLVLLHEAVNELVNFLLFFGKRHRKLIVGEEKANVNALVDAVLPDRLL